MHLQVWKVRLLAALTIFESRNILLSILENPSVAFAIELRLSKCTALHRIRRTMYTAKGVNNDVDANILHQITFPKIAILAKHLPIFNHCIESIIRLYMVDVQFNSFGLNSSADNTSKIIIIHNYPSLTKVKISRCSLFIFSINCWLGW